jgi:hypothetical protein
LEKCFSLISSQINDVFLGWQIGCPPINSEIPTLPGYWLSIKSIVTEY